MCFRVVRIMAGLDCPTGKNPVLFKLLIKQLKDRKNYNKSIQTALSVEIKKNCIDGHIF